MSRLAKHGGQQTFPGQCQTIYLKIMGPEARSKTICRYFYDKTELTFLNVLIDKIKKIIKMSRVLCNTDQ